MPAKTNTTMAADIQTTAREIDFVTRFGRNWDHLRDIMGVSRKIEMLPNTVLKSKYAQGTLQDGKVGEGEEIPYSKYTVKTKDYEKITLEKWAKGTTAEAILENGYENAVQMTDDEMLNDLTADVAGRFYKYLNTGTLKGTSKTFQEAMAMAKGRVLNKFKTMHRTATDVVAFVNVLDVYEYLGTSAVINEQSEFGFNYIKNFMRFPAGGNRDRTRQGDCNPCGQHRSVLRQPHQLRLGSRWFSPHHRQQDRHCGREHPPRLRNLCHRYHRDHGHDPVR